MTNEQRRLNYARQNGVTVFAENVWSVDIRATPRQVRRMKHKAGRDRVRRK